MLSLIQSLARIGKKPPIRIPSEQPVPSKSLRETLNIWNPFQYGITVVTGTLEGAGTDANVYITLYGDGGQTAELSFDNAQKNFERRKIDYFEIVAPEVGELRHIRIRHDNSGDYPEWFLSRITVINLRTNHEWTFFCNRWLAREEEDGKIDRVLYPISECTEYRVGVTTGNLDNAGTDANVLITLFGDHGQSDEFELDDGIDNFERGQTDYFAIYSHDVGGLRRVRIRHDNSGSAPGWFLSRITVSNLNTQRHWTFDCNRWLAKDEDDHKIDRILIAGG